MLRLLLTFSFALTIAITAFGQQTTLERYIQGTGGQVTDTLDNGTIITLDLSTDDAEQENDAVDSYYDDDLDAGWQGAPEDQNLLTLGLRFTELNIPQGALIDSAFVVFHAHEGKSAEDVAMLTIVGEATDDAVTFDETNFTDEYLLTDRPQTNASVEWTVAEDWVIWQPYKTSDIKNVVQELVNRPGWAPGNAMALIFLPQNQGPSIVENAREFTAFENIADPEDVDPSGNPGDGANHPERRPYLQVYFQGTVGLAELKPNLFNVYPNPSSSGHVNLQLKEQGIANVQVINVAGQIVKSLQLSNQNTVLDMSDLGPGLYVLKMVQNGQTSVKRLVIEK